MTSDSRMKKNAFLNPQQVYPYRVHFIGTDSTWFSKGYSVYECNRNSRDFICVARISKLTFKQRLELIPPVERLLRGGIHSLIRVPDGLVAIIKGKVLFAPEREEQLIEVFKIPSGSRPLGLATTPDGAIYFGEYFGNPYRDEVHVFASFDSGRSWEVCYTFKKGAIRHIHNIIYDPYRKGLLVLTGDEDSECKVLLTRDGFRTMEVLIEGNQNARAVDALPLKDGIILPMDSPKEQNYINFLDNAKKMRKLHPIPGSSFSTCRALGAYFISTGVEPSKVNRYPYATIWVSKDGFEWHCIFQAKKDLWPAKLFQYSKILFPRGGDGSGPLLATAFALQGYHNVTLVWQSLEIPCSTMPLE